MTDLPLIVFDVNETLLDLESLAPTFERIFGERSVLRLWFAQLVLYSEALTLAGTYVPFTDIGGAVLKMVATTCGTSISAADRAELTEKFASMPPHPEVTEALRKLRHAGFRLCTLTNNTAEISGRQLERAGLLDSFERRFSVDDVRRHKPAPEVYAAVARAMQTQPSEICLVACHTWDTLGAVAAGWEAALILRPGNALLDVGPQPQITGADLSEVADKLIARYANQYHAALNPIADIAASMPPKPWKETLMSAISYHAANVDGLKIFYREAGRRDAPTLLLLHGFPTSSHMFRDLIPLLADRFHVVAPDLPGFGQSDMPSRDAFPYTFAKLAEVMGRFTQVMKLKRFAIYIFNYGAPVGLRIAIKHPERITAIISQNGNAYEEGLSDGWKPIRAYWHEPTKANRDALRSFLSPETTLWQYTHGVADPSLVSPDGYSLDDFYMARPGAHEAQLDLLLDYASNVALYPKFQSYFRDRQPPLLAVWGRNDPFFLPPGAEAYRRDIPSADVRFFDTGHFALETHCAEIAAAIRDFVGRTAAAAA